MPPNTAPAVPRPASDTTPPKVRWSVLDRETRNITRVNGSGTITVKLGDALNVNFFVDDPEGVRRMHLEGSGTIICQVGDGQSIGLWGDRPQDMTLPQGNSVTTSAFLLSTVSNNPTCVDYDMSFISFSIQYTGSGENYGGLSTSGSLKINFRP